MESMEKVVSIIIESAFRIHRSLGPGLLESVYETLLEDKLKKEGLSVERQKTISINSNGHYFPDAFKADLVVEGVIIELKSVEQLLPVHKKQLLTYLRLSDLPLGILINFGSAYLKDGIKRVANNYTHTVAP